MSVLRFDGPDDVDRAAEHVGREGGADQGGVAAVGAAVDGDLRPVGAALLDDPVDGVEQVVVHLGAPLLVAGVDEVLAVAGRAPEVDLHARGSRGWPATGPRG